MLKTLTGLTGALGGSFSFGPNVEWGYFDQQAALSVQSDPEQTVLENFWEEYPRLVREEVRSALGSFLFSQEEVEKKMGQLSGGERVRLALCKMFQTRPNLLILDEPTNHMDIVGKETLEQMLAAFSGTVLFVSHDRYFIRQVATGILEFEGQEVTQYPYNYEDYLYEKEKRMMFSSGSGAAVKGAGTAVRSSVTSGAAGERGAAENKEGISDGNAPTLTDVFDRKSYYSPGKIKSRLTRQLEKYERLLAESEAHTAQLKLQMMDPALASDYEKLMELQEQLDAEEHNQESLLERMVETETDLQGLEG